MNKQPAFKGKPNKNEAPAAQPPTAEPEKKSNPRLPLLIAGAVALAVSLTIYVMRLDRVVGLIVDDAWYLLLAKALATGQGYTLTNSPSPGITPFYAPAFPALLSIFYRISPSFPGNVWLLKSVSIAAMMGVGFLSFGYFRRNRELPQWVALALALATTIYPALVFLATSSLMSECVFMAAQLGVIVLIERGVKAGQIASAWRFSLSFILIGGALASFAFLTRPAGVGLLIGTVLYLLKEKLSKQAVIFAAVVVVCVGPWMLYSRSHAPTPQQQAEQGANIVQPYTTQLWQKVAGQPLNGTITLGDMPERIGKNLSEIGLFDFGGFAFYSLYRPLEPGEPMRIPSEARMISLFLALLALAGFIATARERMTLIEFIVPLSLGVTLIWGWEQFRLLLPLVPFLFFYLLMGVRLIIRLYEKLYDDGKSRELIPLLVVSWLLALTALHGNYKYIQKMNEPRPTDRVRWIAAYDENEAMMKHIGDTVPKTEIIATQNPALLHLYTGHKTIASDDPAGSWDNWNRMGVKFLARTSPLPLPKADANENQYKTVYRSPGFLNLRLVDLGAPDSRPIWKKN
ncbi:MAG: hypothetical protein ACKVZH_09120 [Blastocatellia bacterium]